MVLLEPWFMSWEGAALISVVGLQNSMDLLKGELGSSDETRVTSTLDGNEVIGIEAERVSGISEVADQETTIPAIKTEPNESCAPVVSVTHISYRLLLDLPAPVSVRPCVTNIWLGNGFWAVLRKEAFILWFTACAVPLAVECFIHKKSNIPFILYGCKMWPVTLNEKRVLMDCEKKFIRRISDL